MNDLHAIADPLRAHPELRLFANLNDFPTSDEDLDCLMELVAPGGASTQPLHWVKKPAAAPQRRAGRSPAA